MTEWEIAVAGSQARALALQVAGDVEVARVRSGERPRGSAVVVNDAQTFLRFLDPPS